MATVNNADARMHMIDICKRMNSTGINQGTSGNLSFRIEGGFLLTPTSLRYEIMQPDDIVEMDFSGNYKGNRKPSSEWRFHRDILAARPDRNVVLHCHSSYATSMAILNLPITSFHYMVGIAGGNDIRCAKYATYGTQELSDNVLEALRERDACLLAHHGQIVTAADLERALRLAVEVETLARFYIQAKAVGEPALLSAAEMGKVIEQMRRMKYSGSPDLDHVGERHSQLA